MKIDFKPAISQDIPEILAMMQEFNSFFNYPFNLEPTRERLLEFHGDRNLGRAWMINSDDGIAGYIILAFSFSFEHGGRDAFIDELFIKSNYRNKGIGKLAMDFIQDEAQKLGIKVIHLEVEKSNEAGKKLYLEKGYQDNGRILLSKKIME